jgi:hypothetical protein
MWSVNLHPDPEKISRRAKKRKFKLGKEKITFLVSKFQFLIIKALKT